MDWRLVVFVQALPFCAFPLVACDHGKEPSATTAPSGSVRSAGQLTPELANKVLAKVGDRTITLGEYAATLDRMDQFERLRYQTADRRRQLLDEIIDAELLSQEAERLGIDKEPETQELVRQLSRDELLRETREKLPPMSEIPIGEVRAYYDAHRADYREPERRRVSVIALSNAATASRVLADAKGANAQQWGELVKKYSIEPSRPGDEPQPPAELAGDRGIVSAPAAGANDNHGVPEAVRAAVFEVTTLGGVLDRVVEADKRFYVVRLTNKSAARDRTFEEAERTIRVRLFRDRVEAAEQQLERDLRKKYPVVVDDAALAQVKVPNTDERER